MTHSVHFVAWLGEGMLSKFWRIAMVYGWEGPRTVSARMIQSRYNSSLVVIAEDFHVEVRGVL
jgi:hypothetical protein